MTHVVSREPVTRWSPAPALSRAIHVTISMRKEERKGGMNEEKEGGREGEGNKGGREGGREEWGRRGGTGREEVREEWKEGGREVECMGGINPQNTNIDMFSESHR